MGKQARPQRHALHRACVIALAGSLSFATVGTIFAEPGQPEVVNLALEATATASGQETDQFDATKANDGKLETRWSSGTERPQKDENTWLALQFKQPVSVAQLVVTLETRTNVDPTPSNVKGFEVQVKTGDAGAWKTVSTVSNTASGDGYLTDLNVKLDQKQENVSALRLTKFDVKDGSTQWDGVSIKEVECYDTVHEITPPATNQAKSIDEVMRTLPDNVTIETSTSKIAVPQSPEGFEIKLNGCDFEQIIAKDGTVHHPFTDKQVKVSWEVKDLKKNESKVSADKNYTVKGAKGAAPAADANAKPQVVPEIQDWWAEGSSKLDVSAITKVTYNDNSLKPMVDEFASDYKTFTGVQLEVAAGAGQAGAFNFTKANPDGDTMLGDEGYAMDIQGDRINVTAPAVTGNMYGAQTILQMTKLYADKQFPQGKMRDYPRFPVRGFMWDVARKPVSLEMMKMATRTMRYYKMNDFQAHLSDNLIFLEDYQTEDDAFANAYAAFRLESGVTNDATGKSATAEDYAITKEAMRDFIQGERALGMNIVPEIDMPAHAVAFTRAFPDLAVRGKKVTTSNKRYAIDHLDLNKSETMPFIESIFDDYTTGANEVFDDETTVHIGADEFILAGGGPAYRKFFNELIPHVKGNGNTVRVWGSLNYGGLQGGDEPIPAAIEGVQMDIWSTGWANPQKMYDKGYQLINITDNPNYMVPNGSQRRGAYGDRLDVQNIYNTFDPATIGGTALPSSDDQILGSGFAIWNDNIDTRASGLTEADEFDRFFEALPVYAENNWAPTGKEKGSFDTLVGLVGKLGMGPGVNPYDEASKTGDTYAEYDFERGLEDASKNNRDLTDVANAAVKDGKLVLAGDASYVASPLKKIAAGTELSFDIELTAPALPGDILFEADAPYGTYDIRVMDNGMLGFTRELYDYYFDYKLPVGKKVNVCIKTQPMDAHKEETMLFVDGQEVGKATGRFFDHGRVKKDGIDNATFAMPLERIGSKTQAIDAKIDNIRVAPLASDAAADVWEKASWKGTTNSQTLEGESAGGHIEHAFDNNPATIWHSNWKSVTEDNKNGDLNATNPIWAEIDLGKGRTINQFSFTPRMGSNSGQVTEANLFIRTEKGGNWKQVAKGVTFKADGSKKTVSFDEATVYAVRFEATKASDKWVAISEFDIANKPTPVNTVYAQGVSYTTAADGALDLASGKPAGVITSSVTDADTSDSVYRTDVSAGTKVTLTAEAGKDMTFVGWFAPGSDEPVSTEPTVGVTADYSVALEARFKRTGDEPVVPPVAEKHTVSFVVDGGVVSSVEVEPGKAVARPADPTREGYTFEGWFLNDAPYDFSVAVTGDITLEARFKKVDDGGSGQNSGEKPSEKPDQKPEQKPGQNPGGNSGNKPASGLPQTGDATFVGVIGSSAVAIVAIIAAVIARKRK